MVHAKLAAAGVQVSVGTVAGIMAENGRAAKRMRAFKRTTIPSDPDKIFQDLIGGDFTAEVPGTKLVGDITGRHGLHRHGGTGPDGARDRERIADSANAASFT
jgi:transposase InsO family protein